MKAPAGCVSCEYACPLVAKNSAPAQVIALSAIFCFAPNDLRIFVFWVGGPASYFRHLVNKLHAEIKVIFDTLRAIWHAREIYIFGRSTTDCGSPNRHPLQNAWFFVPHFGHFFVERGSRHPLKMPNFQLSRRISLESELPIATRGHRNRLWHNSASRGNPRPWQNL